MTKDRSKCGDDISAAWERLAAAVADKPSRTLSADAHLREAKQRPKKVDGRALRKTGRTEQFNSRLKASTKKDIQNLASEHGWLIGETIEHAVAALKEKLSIKPPTDSE